MLGEVLGRAGYNTACIGKWHLGLESPNVPNERGFDHFHGFLGDMMDDYYDHRRGGFNYMRLNEKEIDPAGHATDLFTEWGIDYVRQQAQSKKPFFMYLAYNAPHTPIQPPKEWVERVKEREEGIDENRAKLVALIEHLDDGIGKVVGAMKEAGIYDNSLVIFTSDNGGQVDVGASNGELNGSKGQMYEGGLRVPFCAVWPGKIERGLRNDKCVGLTMDLFPTICEAAGTGFEHEIDGKSILPILLGRSEGLKKRYMFWVRREGWNHGGRAFYAARYGDWKLLQNDEFEPMELYNLKDDAGEENPLGREHEMYGKLFGELRNHIIRSGRIVWQRPAGTGE
jgi:arylsulfatase A-like enzyme